MNKNGKMGAGLIAFFWIVGIVGGIVVLMALFGGEQAQVGVSPTTTTVGTTTCPSDLTWSGTVNVQNTLNATTAQTYDASAYFYKTGTDTLKTSITDTTAGAVTLTCGETYDVKILSTGTGIGTGDGGYIHSFSASGASLNDDGSATFTAQGDGEVLTIGTKEWGSVEIQLFSEIDNAFATHLENEGTNYTITDGANFTGATGTTGFTVGAGGELDFTWNIRAVNSSLNYNDHGIYVLIDAVTTVWDEPVVSIDGNTVSNIKNQLTGSEALAYSNYEYVYLIPKGRDVTQSNKLQMGTNFFALGGVDPVSEFISVDFAPIGTYTSTANSNILKIGAVSDSTSQTQIHNLHDTVISVL